MMNSKIKKKSLKKKCPTLRDIGKNRKNKDNTILASAVETHENMDQVQLVNTGKCDSVEVLLEDNE